MMWRARRVAAAATVVVLSSLASPASARPAHAEELGLSVDTSRFPEVVATVSLPDELADLTLDTADVTVREDGRVRKATVSPMRAQAVPVVLVVDTSGSMRGAPIAQARDAATAFARTLPASWPVAVVGFGSRPSVLLPFTSDREAVAHSLASLTASGETALYDAVDLTAGYLREQGAGRATVVLLSDGGDTVSTVGIDAALQRLAPHVRLEIVELASPESDRDALARLAAGRGRVTSVIDGAGLTAVYAELARTLGSEYLVRYTSAASEPVALTVHVRRGLVDATASSTIDPPRPMAAAPAPPPRETPSALTDGDRWLLLAGAGLVFLALAVLCSLLALPRRRLASLEALARLRASGRQSEILSDVAARAVSAAESALAQGGRRRRLNDLLDDAGVALRAGEFLVLAASTTLAAAVLASLLAGPFVGLLAAVAVALLARGGLGLKIERRRRAFADLLPDVVQMLTSSLRAGYALSQAIDSVAREAPSPAGEELHRVVVETRLGRDLVESLRSAAERLASPDFDWVVQAIEIQREVGGDLAEVLDNVAHTIRERTQLHRHVKALTAEGRLSAYILLALPPFLALALSVINPEYIAQLTHGPGLFMAAVGVVLMGVGALWFKALCKLQY